jgi:hypothetical protein
MIRDKKTDAVWSRNKWGVASSTPDLYQTIQGRTGRETQVYFSAESREIAEGKATDIYGYHYDVVSVEFLGPKKEPDLNVRGMT